ncbi:hypothetical protein MKW92_007520 [Papaver armeniacum]|nr:hypothetical protein MKW92_007520 [Papaver armeniacum]
MGVTRRGSPSLSAGSNLLLMIIICMSIYAEMGAAWWPDICTPGDTYVERNHINIPEKCDSSVCSDWCNSECASIGRPVAKTNCQQPPPYLDCQCCCKAPTPPPCSPPSPSLPPSPPPPPPVDGKWPDGSLNTNVCAAGQEYVQITHEDINDCSLKPQCETKCKEKGLYSAGSQCVGSSRDYQGTNYSWFEQCCCTNVPPPPPPCSSCCGNCCPVDIDIQISVKQGSGQPSKVTL